MIFPGKKTGALARLETSMIWTWDEKATSKSAAKIKDRMFADLGIRNGDQEPLSIDWKLFQRELSTSLIPMGEGGVIRFRICLCWRSWSFRFIASSDFRGKERHLQILSRWMVADRNCQLQELYQTWCFDSPSWSGRPSATFWEAVPAKAPGLRTGHAFLVPYNPRDNSWRDEEVAGRRWVVNHCTSPLMISADSSDRVLVFSLMLNGIIFRSLSLDSDLPEVRSNFSTCMKDWCDFVGDDIESWGLCEELRKW